MGPVEASPKHDRLIGNLLIAAAAITTVILGKRAWWIMPPVVFAGSIAYMLIDRRRPVTTGLVLFAAAVAIALGAFLRLFLIVSR